MPDNPTTIYLVTTNENGEYGIEAMFSTREKAQAYVDARKLADYDEGREIDEWIVDEKEGWLMRPQWSANIQLQTGEISYHSEKPNLVFVAPHIRNEPPSIRDRGAASYNNEVAYIASFVSAEHALKLAAEVRQQWLREQGVVNAEGSMWLADDGIYVKVI